MGKVLLKRIIKNEDKNKENNKYVRRILPKKQHRHDEQQSQGEDIASFFSSQYDFSIKFMDSQIDKIYRKPKNEYVIPTSHYTKLKISKKNLKKTLKKK